MEWEASRGPWDSLRLGGVGTGKGDLPVQPMRSSRPLSVTPTASVVTNPGWRPETSTAPGSTGPLFPPWASWSLSFLFVSVSVSVSALGLCFSHSLSLSVCLSIVSCSFSILLTLLSITSPGSLDNHSLHYWNPKQSKTKDQRGLAYSQKHIHLKASVII